MMVIRIIMFLITAVIAKHYHRSKSVLDLNDNFFSKVYTAIHTVVDNLFESIDLPTKFSDTLNTKLLLKMHNDLSNIAGKPDDTFNDIQKIIKDNVTHIFNYQYQTDSEDVIQVDTMVDDILNEKNFSVYSIVKGSEDRPVKDKTNNKSKTKVKDISEFEDSKEFTDFDINLLGKANNRTKQNFKKFLKYGKYTVPSKQNIKAWDAPSNLELDIYRTNTRRIFKGLKTKVNSYPFIVSIHIMGEFTCSGCIISKDFIITAASCVRAAYTNKSSERNLKSIYVRLGTDHVTRGGETIPVEELYFHPEYEPAHLLNNLAIIRLEKRVHFSSQQKKIRRIAWDKTPGDFPNDTKSILIVGWGATKSDQVKQLHPKLRMGMLDIYNTNDCRQNYSKDFITGKHFCAAYNGTIGGACIGDSGGPAIVDAVLMGVISFGAKECGVVGAPTVFTKLGYYAPWIESVLNLNDKTRNGTKFNDLNLFQVDLQYPRGHVEEEEAKLYTDVLVELIKTNQSVVDDVIYGEYFDEFNKYFKNEEQIESKEKFIVKENKSTTTYTTTPEMLQIKNNSLTKTEATPSTQTPLYSNSDRTLRHTKPPTYFEYETNDAEKNDYTDNYEKYIEKKQSFDNKKDIPVTFEELNTSDKLNKISNKNKEFYARN